jgi:L-iditol 2-dehydrogenase
VYYARCILRLREGPLQAAVLTGPERIELREVAEPVPGREEATVRVRAVGICGTDLSIFKGKIPVTYPRIIGHEAVGVVLSSPDGGPEPGTRVVVDPNVACGRCVRCREGRGNICSEGWLLGRDRDGALQGVVAVPLANLHRLPEEVEDHVAPLIQVLTTCVHGQRMTEVFPGDAVVVVGIGVTGLLHVQLAKLRGADPVVAVTRNPARLELARELGADLTIPGDDPSAVDLVREATAGGADVAIECAGTVATLAGAVGMVRPGGRILAYGTIAESQGAFPFYDLYYKELAITGARAAQAEDFPVALKAITSGSVRLEPLMGRRIGLGEVEGALRSSSLGGLKTVVDL